MTFVDTPVSQYTVLYARYFLYALNERKDIDSATRVRHLLFLAAAQNINTPEKLGEYLKKNGVKYKVSDPTPTFNFLTGYLTEDKVRSTPTAVILDSGRKHRQGPRQHRQGHRGDQIGFRVQGTGSRERVEEKIYRTLRITKNARSNWKPMAATVMGFFARLRLNP